MLLLQHQDDFFVAIIQINEMIYTIQENGGGDTMGIYDLDLQELPLFEGLKADEVEQFIQATGAKVKRYGKEVRILKAYETNSRIGIIVEGEALVLAEDRFGNETIGHRLERGALFGSTTAILPGYASPTAIEAVSDVLVLWVPYTALLVAGPRLGRIHASSCATCSWPSAARMS
ncbi:cyclic nucleotide-binding domain protein [Mitsuokella multacida DSM 20544]|uniref:Cyclic nucleotide-binding domain protein n=2 Tax=Mitsuokella multacida TaxID=52226 RepID=C9KN67_9FIRM|nr:cyclic nucleotide-binding domain protein [Mitsuokella multacida DSM 20544]